LEAIRAAIQTAGVACSERKADRRPAQGPECVKLTTLHSSKGLEFPIVFVVALDQLDAGFEERIEQLRLLYVGMTRATHRLHLSSVGTSKIATQVEQALERIKRAYQ
jgi:superfamily I DNA/RNA helicase